MALKILSANCQGLGSKEKRLDVFNYLKDRNCDIYCLQDTHTSTISERIFRTHWNSEALFSSGTSNSRGVCILFRKQIDYKIHSYSSDSEGNYIICDLTVDTNRLTLINLYGPNRDSPNFFDNIIKQAEEIGNISIIICGDFNIIQDQNLDSYNYKNMNNIKAHKKLEELKISTHLFDPFRELYPTLKRYTWRRKSPIKQARLDFFLISENLLPLVNKTSIESSYRSDHSMIILDITFVQIQKGKPLWKHNNSLLHDLNYINTINTKIDEIKKQYALPIYNIDQIQNIPDDQIQFLINDQLFLDTLLMELRGKSISYSTHKKKQIDKRENELINKIKTLEEHFLNNSTCEIDNLKEELKAIRHNKMNGILIRSRAQIIEQDEKPTQFFCNLEKFNYMSKIIPKLQKENGTIVTNQQDILQEFKSFYEDLYASKENTLIDIDLFDLFRNIEIPKLDNYESKSIEGQITYNEAASVLKSMSNNKSPGSDGFTAEFFKMFWGNLGHFIIRSLNYGFRKGELSITQREGIITCIPKDNKPRHFTKNYRPISLLNCIYKLASGVIAARIKRLLPKLIHPDQTGFIAGRYIGENIRLVYDIMHFTEENKIPGLLLSIDFEKAFDSVSWSFIYKVLELFGFGESIISWIKVFNKNVRLSVNQHGNLSEFFSIGRGCRQGDPVSTFLFLLCAEVLAIMVRNNTNIKGIMVNDRENKLSQYADDTLFILDGSCESLNATLDVLHYYSNFSGLRVNFDKTHAVWIGINKYSAASIKTKWKLSWGKVEFKLLGIIFHVDLDKMEQINFMEKIQKIRALVKLWRRRSLTPLGKITVIKCMLLPILNHLFISLPNPSDVIIKEINSLFFEFLWEGPHKIKQSVVVKQYTEGGLKMVNLTAFIKSMKLTWLRRIIIAEKPWQLTISKIINQNKLFIFGTKYIKLLLKKTNNKFWIDVLKAYSEVREKDYQNENQNIFSSPIYYNHKIMVGNKPIYIKEWYEKGIWYINDLLHENGRFYTQYEFENKYNLKTNFIQFAGIIKALKTLFKDIKIIDVKKSSLPIIPKDIKLLLKSLKGGSDFYYILNKNEEKPTSKLKWNNVYDIEEETWKNIYDAPFKLMLGTKLQWFQLRIIHRILPTKKHLFNMKLAPSPNCSICQEAETITHMLWQCQETQCFLRETKKWLKEFDINITFTEELFIFNVGNMYSLADLHLLQITKYYIFVTKHHNHSLSLKSLKYYIKYFFNLVRNIAMKNNSLENFENDYALYKQLLDSLNDEP